jgi:hypothetical protein
MFTDETKLRLFDNKLGGNIYVIWLSKERLNPKNVSCKIKYEVGGIMLWCCINYNKIG